MKRGLRLTQSAEGDLRRILAITLEDFGPAALARYRALIGVALRELQDSEAPPGSLARPELGDDVRSYHLRLCRGRAAVDGRAVGQPRHLLVFRSFETETVVLRVPHDAMELSRHLPSD